MFSKHRRKLARKEESQKLGCFRDQRAMIFVRMLHVLEAVYIDLVAVETVAGMF